MIENSESNTLIVVAVDFKFKQFDYDRFEIEYLKQYADIIILDISYLSSRSYHMSIAAVQYAGDDLKLIISYRQLLSEITLIKRQYNKANVVVMNFVTPNSFSSLVFLAALKRYGINTVKYYNPGVPKISSLNNNITIRYMTKAIKRRFYHLISRLLRIFPSYCIYAGDYWRRTYEPVVNKYGARWLSGNTWDYSNILLNSRCDFDNNSNPDKKVVLLDGAAPMFGSDDVNIGKKTYMTNEVWYPSLVRFFDELEKLSNVTVEIAAHPKTSHQSKPPYFGFRNVYYGKSREMVSESDFVITRGSTAISYAVIYKKPVIFIYSNQMKEGKLAMASTNRMSELLGTQPVNIDEKLTKESLKKLLEVNESCYQDYKNNYLTSSEDVKTNAQILLQDVLNIQCR